ncbi:methyltransferase domain-containing protein, partial [Candidatus Woesearchaeota archaeon]|nr:methyltransferase domain-containing protein [Candidatus Woesearchaeota archaeon]
MTKLNLGCGQDIKESKEGWVNADKLKLKGVDVCFDFNKTPWPFTGNMFEEIYTSHVLEHLDNLPEAMKEIHRICKPNAKITIRVPHFSCGVSYWDPTHKRTFSYFTFDYFREGWFYDLPKFRVVKRKINFTRQKFTFLNYILNPIINLSPLLYERFFCWILPSSECLFELEVI